MSPPKSRLHRSYLGEQRTRIAESFALNRARVQVRPTAQGKLLLAIILMFIVASVYYHNEPSLAVASALLCLLLVSWRSTLHGLVGLQIELGHAYPVFVGEHLHIPLRLSSASKRAYAPIELIYMEQLQHTYQVPAQGRSQGMIDLPTTRRGWLPQQRFLLRSSYPFGLLQASTWVRLHAPCLVYPGPLNLPHNATHASSVVQSDGDADFSGLRRYQTGDSLKQVDWKAYARGRDLLSKQFSEETSDPQILSWDALAGLETEHRLSYLSFLILQMIEQKQKFGLQLPSALILPDQGEAHIQRCLTALALYEDAHAS